MRRRADGPNLADDRLDVPEEPVITPDVAVGRHRLRPRNRRLGLAAVLGALVGSGLTLVIVAVADAPAARETVRLGRLSNYPAGDPVLVDLHRSITAGDLRVWVIGPDGDHPAAPVVLLDKDPSSGCHLQEFGEPNQAFPPIAGARFYDPCHGDQFDVTGRLLHGPSPVGMFGFSTRLDGDEELVIDLHTMSLGGTR